jgi:hypothetical protein
MIDLFLRNIKIAYDRHDLTKLERLVKQLLNITPVPKLEIQFGVPIQRLRNNYHSELFTSEDEISFRQDYRNIKEFGRCNFPNSSKFYGSLNSKYINETRIVNVLETNKEFREKKMVRKRQIFTSGEWITTQPLNVAIFPFDRNAILYNEEIKFHAEKFGSIIGEFTPEQKVIYKRVLKFISYYYSLKHIFNPLDYTISAYITELLFDKYGFDGILYPSVRAEYKTYNLVIEPNSVISKLRLDKAAMFELYLVRKNAFIDNVAYADISRGFKLYWNYTERTSETELKCLL